VLEGVPVATVELHNTDERSILEDESLPVAQVTVKETPKSSVVASTYT
jgi:hypothetical protein